MVITGDLAYFYEVENYSCIILIFCIQHICAIKIIIIISRMMVASSVLNIEDVVIYYQH